VAAACAMVAALTLLASDGLVRGAAMVAAGLELPQGAPALLASQSAPEGEIAVVVKAPAASDNQPKASKSAVKAFDITATPMDIQAVMDGAWAEFADQKREGDIKEKSYKYHDGTQELGNISIRNTTATHQSVDIKKRLETKLPLKIDPAKPAVLIYHTHTTEGYELIERPWYARDWVSRTENGGRSVVRVGEAIAEILQRAGYQVIHDTTIYDRQYNGAYDRSRVMVRRVLKENPGLLITLDVHRDSIHLESGARIKPVAEINGKKAAQVMLITGIEEGLIIDYPDWERNLDFALQLQREAENLAPGLMRPIFFCPRRYNMNETPYSLLLEMGSDANTLEEAVYSGRLMGQALANWMDGHKS